MKENPQLVNSAAGAPTSDDDTMLAAISDVLNREDIGATEKCHRMAALLVVEEPALSLERQAQRLAWAVWQKTAGRCTYCDGLLNPFERTAWNGYQIDHILPRAQGGTDGIENLTPACARCNWTKQARTPEEWGANRG